MSVAGDPIATLETGRLFMRGFGRFDMRMLVPAAFHRDRSKMSAAAGKCSQPADSRVCADRRQTVEKPKPTTAGITPFFACVAAACVVFFASILATTQLSAQDASAPEKAASANAGPPSQTVMPDSARRRTIAARRKAERARLTAERSIQKAERDLLRAKSGQ